MSKAVAEIGIGAALIGLDLLLPGAGIALTPALTEFLIGTGSSLLLGGIGTLLSKNLNGISTTIQNPIAPWGAIYGRSRVGGTLVYVESTGTENDYLHMVYVLACHPCQSVDAVLFNGQRVLLDQNGNSLSFNDSTPVIAHQQQADIAYISRQANTVTVRMKTPLSEPAPSVTAPPLVDGDRVKIQNVSGDRTLNGEWNITVVDAQTFTYQCGGNPVALQNDGQVETAFVDWGDTVHMESLLGNHTATFPGLLSESNGIWTAQHKLLGRAAVYLRLKYGGNTYASGLPNVSFLVKGNNHIFDPRSNSYGYSENAVLCTADYLANQVYGFKANYGTEIPLDPLIAGANICDEQVACASGLTEPRYTCNGGFFLSTRRSEILQNLLTSCAGRLTYSGGQFIIHVGGWPGASAILPLMPPILAAFPAGPTTGNGGSTGGGITNRYISGAALMQASTPDTAVEINLGGPWTVDLQAAEYPIYASSFLGVSSYWSSIDGRVHNSYHSVGGDATLSTASGSFSFPADAFSGNPSVSVSWGPAIAITDYDEMDANFSGTPMFDGDYDQQPFAQFDASVTACNNPAVRALQLNHLSVDHFDDTPGYNYQGWFPITGTNIHLRDTPAGANSIRLSLVGFPQSSAGEGPLPPGTSVGISGHTLTDTITSITLPFTSSLTIDQQLDIAIGKYSQDAARVFLIFELLDKSGNVINPAMPA